MFKLRFWWIFIKALIARPSNETVGRLGFWVTPFDIDINMHLNDGCYIKFMDLGRWDLLLRHRLLPILFKAKLQPVVVNIDISFKKSIAPFAYFTLESELFELGEKSFKFRQTFKQGDRIAAEATATAVFVQNGRAAPTSIFIELIPQSLRDAYGKSVTDSRS